MAKLLSKLLIGLALAVGISTPTVGKAENSLFVGNMVVDGRTDNITNYANTNGAQVVAQTVNTPWQENTAHNVSVGARTPRFLDGRLRLSGVTDFDTSFDGWGYTIITEGSPRKDLTLRAGPIHSSRDIFGGFVGGFYTHDNFTLDLDAWHDGSQVNGHGYVAGVLDRLYIGLGGDPRAQTLVTVNSWMNNGGFGFHNQAVVDLDDKVQGGKLVVADRLTKGRKFLDFRSHALNGTEMQGVATGGVLNSWPPFDAYSSERFALVGSWSNNPAAGYANGRFFYRPNKDLFFGVGAGNIHEKVNSNDKPFVGQEIYARVPGTPLEGWLSTDLDLDTGKVSYKAYLGGSGTF